MKQILLSILFSILVSFSLGQDTYYSVADGKWGNLSTWAMDPTGTIPAVVVPTSNDTVYIRDSVHQTVPSGHIHRGNVFIAPGGIFEIFSGSGVSTPYIFAGDSFVVEGRLYTSSDFHNQKQFTAGSDGTGVLVFGVAALIDIGDDLIVNSNSFTLMNNALCGDGTSFDDMYFKGTQALLCGNGKFVIPDKLRAWNDNNVEQIPPNPQLIMQICNGFNFYGTVGDCENETNPIITGGGTFPVEFVSFTAQKTGNDVSLQWITASEINNDFFTVERSFDGIEYDIVENIDGAGNSNEFQTYNITDAKPGVGTIWYRLKQTDIDGNHSFAPIVRVTIGEVTPEFIVYPNPARGNPFFVDLQGFRADTEIGISVLDLTGKTVYEDRLNTDRNGALNTSIAPEISRGVYIMRVNQAGKTITRKLIF